MKVYSVRKRKTVEMVEITKEKTLKNGAKMLLGKDANGDKVSTIVRGDGTTKSAFKVSKKGSKKSSKKGSKKSSKKTPRRSVSKKGSKKGSRKSRK